MTAFVLIPLAALAAPPSSALSGPEGSLTWDITEAGDRVEIRGASPKWTVEHTASADLSPIRTVRTNADGTRVTVEYGGDEVIVALPGKEVRHERADLWDGDTLDVRLGSLVAEGRHEIAFDALDVSNGKVYSFDSRLVAAEQCGSQPCSHIRVQLTGLLRLVGPSWDFWYAGDGELLRFDGPAGSFAAVGVQ